jgi:hypothetical protein
MRVIRAESEDPLQDGFGAGGQVEVRVAEISLDRGKRLLNRGTCPFCKEQFYNTGAAIEHLRNMLAGAGEQEAGADVHTTDSVTALLDLVGDVSKMHEPASSGGEIDELDARVVYDSVERNIDSEDDLFADAGLVHSDSEEELEQKRRSPIGPSRITRDPVSPLASRSGSLEIPDSDEPEMDLTPFVPNISGQSTPDSDGAILMLRPQGSSARRHQKSSSFHSVETGANELSTSTPAATPYPAFKETADPFDRNGDRDYRDRNWKSRSYQQQERSHLSLRPRRTQKRISVEVPPLSPEPSKSRTAPAARRIGTKPGKRTTKKKRKQSQPCEPEAVPADHARASVPFDQAIGAATSAVRAVSESLTRWGQTHQIISDGEEAGEQYHTPTEVRCSPEPVDADDDLPPFPDFDNTPDCEDDDVPLDPGDDNHTRDGSEPASVQNFGNDVGLNDHFSPFRISSTPSAADELDMLFAGERADETSGSDLDDSEAVYHFSVADYRSLVIMHEVQGHDLEAVGEQMSERYHSYRMQVRPFQGIRPEAVWTEDDEMLLWQLSLTDHTLMETIKRRLPHLSQFDIGNRLAEWWLYEIYNGQQQSQSTRPGNVVPLTLTKPPHAKRAFHLRQLDQSPGSLDAALPRTTFSTLYEHSRRSKHPPEPISQRVCRQQNARTGTWHGCGRIFSQRSAVVRHWKITERACLREGFDRTKKPEKRRRRRTAEGFEELEGAKIKGGEVQCREMSPGGETVVRGCGKWFSQKSTMYRHWRQMRGRECRPEWYRWPSEPLADEGRPGTGDSGGDGFRERPGTGSSAAETADSSASSDPDGTSAKALPRALSGQAAVVLAGLDVSAIVRPNAAAADTSGAGSS